jgi:dTDP-4-amino-4,6-dideoxygalactose transaminase
LEVKVKVPFLDLKAQYHSIKKEIDQAVLGVLESTSFVLGKKVNDFEEAFAKTHGVKHCIGVSSGTDGNHSVLWALGIGPGDEVIVPANTFIATAWGATLCGAKPVFVDCHPESYNLDPEKIEAAITPKTKAIVAVYLYGQAADMDGISTRLSTLGYQQTEPGVFIHKNSGQKIYLVEDCAQAHLAEYKGKKVGGLGKASSFSFYPGKNLGAYGEAGAVMTNDDELAKKFRMIRDHGAEQKYIHEIYGHNYRMEAIQAAVLNVKLKHLEAWTEGRRRVASKYRELLHDIGQITLPKEMDYAKHVYHLFVIQVKGHGQNASKRDELQRYLNENGVATGLHYPLPLHLQPCFKGLGYKKGDFPIAEQLAESGLSLPIYPEMTLEQVEHVASSIRGFFRVH